MPKVTVLMAVYNGERYLQETIDSILVQTLEDLEFLIINDASTDSTQEIICSYNDPRIRLINNEQNIGLTRSLNKGLELAQGELIARQDGDDISYPERLAKQVAFLEQRPEVVLVGTYCRAIDSHGKLIENWLYPDESTQIRWTLLFQNAFAHPSVMFRKSLILEHIGFYNEDVIYAQDYDFWSRIARKFKIANLNEYLVSYRINSLSMTATYGNLVYDEAYKIQFSNINSVINCHFDQYNIWSDIVMELDAMSLLWRCNLTNIKYFNFQYLSNTIDKIYQIYFGFCNYYQLNKQESKQLYDKLSYNLSLSLLHLANYYYLQQEKSTGRKFLFRSFFLKKNILFSKKYIKTALKLFLYSGILETINLMKNQRIPQ